MKIIQLVILVSCVATSIASVKSSQASCNHLFRITSAHPNPPGSAMAVTMKWGLMDCNGKIVVNPVYEGLGEDIFPYEPEADSDVGVLIKGKDSFIVDVFGNIRELRDIVIESEFSEGYAVARKGKNLVLINKKGVPKINLTEKYGSQIEGVGTFQNGLAVIFLNDGVGFINTKGEMVIPPKFDHSNGFYDGVAVVVNGGKVGLINQKGEFVIPPIDDGNVSIADASDGLVKVYKTLPDKDNKISYFDTKGKLVIEVSGFDYVGDFSEGLVAFEKDGKWGYLNRDGKVAIEPRFEDARDFGEGLAAVKIGSNWGFIDSNGEIAIAADFSEVITNFRNGLAYVSKGNRIGYVNRRGDWVWSRCNISCPNLENGT
ncbi:MAG: WG repeat-containing protein [Pyrinomonadaceae bacterium]